MPTSVKPSTTMSPRASSVSRVGGGPWSTTAGRSGRASVPAGRPGRLGLRPLRPAGPDPAGGAAQPQVHGVEAAGRRERLDRSGRRGADLVRVGLAVERDADHQPVVAGVRRDQADHAGPAARPVHQAGQRLPCTGSSTCRAGPELGVLGQARRPGRRRVGPERAAAGLQPAVRVGDVGGGKHLDAAAGRAGPLQDVDQRGPLRLDVGDRAAVDVAEHDPDPAPGRVVHPGPEQRGGRAALRSACARSAVSTASSSSEPVSNSHCRFAAISSNGAPAASPGPSRVPLAAGSSGSATRSPTGSPTGSRTGSPTADS